MVCCRAGIPSEARDLLFEAGAGGTANFDSDLLVVEADFAERAVAPAMAAVPHLVTGSGEHFIRQGGDVQFFGSQMAADVVRLHNQAVSCRSVRRTSARTIGIL